jgi:cytochrome P450
VEEALRIDPPVPIITRYSELPVSVAGVQIPAGSPVLFGIGAANRDPTEFPSPEEFSLDRGAANHVAFGRGPHFCIGAHLARAEMRVMLDLVLDRLPGLRLVEPEEVVFLGALQRGPAKLRIAFDGILEP